MKAKHILASSVAAAVALPAFNPQALAQAAGGDKPAVLEELVVTAQRRSGDLQQVPIAVTALDEASMERRQILSTEDIFTEVPGLIGSNNVGQNTAVTFFLRGIGTTESIVTVDPAVGVYVDDVYIARQGVNNFALYDLERIEVLRGPQGTLYGRNSSAGAVKVITKEPEFETTGRISAGVGNYGQWFARGSFNTAIVEDKLAVRVNYMEQEDDGYSDNLTLGRDVNKTDFMGWRVAALWQASDTLRFIAAADYMEDDSDSVYPANLAPLPSEPPFIGLFDLYSDTEQRNLGEASGYSLTAFWDIGPDTTLKSITAVRETIQVYNLDLSDSVTPIYELFTDNDSDQISQEFNLSGSFDEGRFEYTSGLFYFKEESDAILGNEFNLRVPGEGGFVTAPPLYFEQHLQTDSESYAVYGELTWNLSADVSVFLGGRYTTEEKNIDVQFYTAPAPGNFPALPADRIQLFDTGVVESLGTPTDIEFDEFTPRIGIDWSPSDDLNLYASYSRGFKSGGWLARLVFPNPEELTDFPAEIVDSYEVGLKSQLFDNRVRANVAMFYTDFQDLFNTFTNVNGGFSGATTDAEIYGLEAEGTYRVNSVLDLYANFALMDGEYADDLPPGLDSVLGDDLQRLPGFQGKVGVSAIYPLGSGNGSLIANFDYSMIGDHYLTITNAPISESSYDIANATVGWESENQKYKVLLRCRNCFDEEYFHSLLDFSGLGFAPAYPGQPRFYTLELEASL
ncbi:MAG: TonB-dependent receptor [Pseudohaliea sp.]